MVLDIKSFIRISFFSILCSCADSELPSYVGTNSYLFPVQNAANLNISITTSGNRPWSVNWGDGQETTNIISGAEVNHTYTFNFTGNIEVETSGSSSIQRFESTSGRWSFDIQLLPRTLTHLSIEGESPNDNILSGNILFLPSGLQYFKVMGSNTITGDIGLLPLSISEFIIDGSNLTFGNVGNLPSSILRFDNDGQNTTTGNISTLPANLQNYRNLGQNTTTGSLASLKSVMRHFHSEGQNTISGNIANLPTNLISFNLAGNNTTTGDVIGLPSSLISYENKGSNTTFGNLINLPRSLTSFINEGSNTTTGDIAFLPSNLIVYKNAGQNTTSGFIRDLPSTLTHFHNSGANTTTALGTSWGGSTTNFTEFYLQGSTTRTQNEIDNILVALTNIISWSNQSLVNLQGLNNASPTGIGQAARATLLSNGATSVLVN